MTQQRRLFAPERKSAIAKADKYDEANLRSARDVLSDVERWGGEKAGLVQWARAVVGRLGGCNRRVLDR